MARKTSAVLCHDSMTGPLRSIEYFHNYLFFFEFVKIWNLCADVTYLFCKGQAFCIFVYVLSSFIFRP